LSRTRTRQFMARSTTRDCKPAAITLMAAIFERSCALGNVPCSKAHATYKTISRA